jgi:hypothetical protein
MTTKPAKSTRGGLTKRQQAARRQKQRRTQRRLNRIAGRAGLVLAVFAVAAVIIFAYRSSVLAPESVVDMMSKPAPEFTLPGIDGKEVRLSELRKGGNVLLYFNEGYG